MRLRLWLYIVFLCCRDNFNWPLNTPVARPRGGFILGDKFWLLFGIFLEFWHENLTFSYIATTQPLIAHPFQVRRNEQNLDEMHRWKLYRGFFSNLHCRPLSRPVETECNLPERWRQFPRYLLVQRPQMERHFTLSQQITHRCLCK